MGIGGVKYNFHDFWNFRACGQVRVYENHIIFTFPIIYTILLHLETPKTPTPDTPT